MKLFNKIIVSSLFIAPIMIATPILLTSCGSRPVDKDNNTGISQDKQQYLTVFKSWELLKVNETYVGNDRLNKDKPVYFFKSGDKSNTFNLESASPQIKNLVLSSFNVGQTNNILDKKTENAIKSIVDTGFEKVQSESQKSKYIKKGFDLSQKSNFELLKQFFGNQSYKNIHSINNTLFDGLTYNGSNLWFDSDKFEILKDYLRDKINCDISVSLTETGNNSEKIQYEIIFSFQTKDKTNWPGKDTNNPIEIHTEFETSNFLSLYLDKTTNNTNVLPTSEKNGNDLQTTSFYLGDITKTDINVDENIFNKSENLINSFANSGYSATKYSTNDWWTLLDQQINIQKINNLLSLLPSTNEKFNYIKNKQKTDFNIPNNLKLSIPFAPNTSSDNSNVSSIDGAFIHRVDVSTNNQSQPSANDKSYINIRIRFHKKAYKWFWGSWQEVYSSSNNPASQGEILLSIGLKY